MIDRNFCLVVVLRRWIFHDFVLLSPLHHAVCLNPKVCAAPRKRGSKIERYGVTSHHLGSRPDMPVDSPAGGAFESPHSVTGGVAKLHDRTRML